MKETEQPQKEASYTRLPFATSTVYVFESEEVAWEVSNRDSQLQTLAKGGVRKTASIGIENSLS